MKIEPSQMPIIQTNKPYHEQLFKTLLTTAISRLKNGEIAGAEIAEIDAYTRKLILELISGRQVVLE